MSPVDISPTVIQSVGITPIEVALFVFILITAVLTALFRDVLAAIVIFAAYSLGLAVVYTFYRAPDVGLTEAAIGAGVTTVFLLLAAYCFARSSPTLHDWLLGHRILGPFILNWQDYGAISARAKLLAVATMGATLAAVFVLSRPTPPPG